MSIFSKVQTKRPPSNTFDLSHDRKMSLDMGNLVPILAMECVPGDKINMSTSQMLRFAPMITPVMHQVTVYTHFFFVPNRLTWSNWEDFITGGEDGLNTSVFPTSNYNGAAALGSLEDYLGLTAGLSSGEEFLKVSVLPFAAYQKIYNEYYRDQNLIPKVDDEVNDGFNSLSTLNTLRTRAWQHDYFTSALPWTQKGAEATIPIGNIEKAVLSDGTDFVNNSGLDALRFRTESPWNEAKIEGFTDSSTWEPAEFEAQATTINDLRNAFRLQEWLEKNARGGTRYIESILSHFGVRSPDGRLQRPEFLGGGSSPVTISEVLQTSAAASEPTPQGNMAGHGISVGANNSFSYTATEHGYVIGIMSILPKTAYQQGIPKHFLKFDKFDYYWPSFAHLGEQPILNKELYHGISDNDDIFGYTPRYAEYKYMNSSVHGEFRDSLDFWHMGRKFSSRPSLNSAFIEADPTDRIFAVPSGEKIYCHLFHRIKARRLMPYFGTPTF